MSRKLLLSLLALLIVTPALAQIRMVLPPKIIAPVVQTDAAQANVSPPGPLTFDVANDPDRARALINKLRLEKREVRQQYLQTLAQYNETAKMLDEMTRRGGSLVHATCEGQYLSVRTDGAGSENCAASGYICGSVEGTCRRTCTTSNDCAGGYVCDIGAARCVPPPIASDD